MTIPQEAIEAAARASAIARRGVTAHVKDLDRQAAQATITAARPAIEQQIREQVAQEIRSARINGTARLDHLHNSVLEIAAQIARGKEQP